jgi:transcriptional regulator of arginine metabolism
MTKRSARQELIKSLIRSNAIKTQRDLVEALKAAGQDCTQATVSRDIAEMNLAKSENGYYVLPEDLRLHRLISELADSIEAVECFIVIRTPPGMGMSIAAALDDASLDQMAGCIAGDDTVFVLAHNRDDAASLEALLEHMRES